MFKNLIIVFLVIIYNKYLILLDDEVLYRHIVDIAGTNNLLLFSCTTIISFAIVLGAYMSLQGSMYRLIYSVSKILIQASQFLIALICIYNIYFWFLLDFNLIQDMSYLSFLILFELLSATCIAVRFIDFNYHFQNSMVEAISLAIISVLFVELIGPAYFG